MVGLRALVNGASWSGRERNRLFCNDRGVQFADVSGISGLDSDRDGRVFAVFDYDRDGWQDIAVLNINSPVFSLYRNNLGERRGQHEGQMTAFRFVGGNQTAQPSSDFSNRDGYGAVVTVYTGGMELEREHRCGEGLSAQNSATMIVGMGANKTVDKVSIRWPSGRVQQSESFESGQLVTIYEDPAQSPTGEVFTFTDYTRDIKAPGRPSSFAATTRLVLPSSKESPEQLRMYTTTATWCENCKALLPHLDHLRANFAPTELGMFGVPIDPTDVASKLAAYQAKYAPAYELLTILSAEQVSSVQQIVQNSLNGDGLPATIVTDGDGAVLLTMWGAPSVSEIRKLQSALR